MVVVKFRTVVCLRNRFVQPSIFSTDFYNPVSPDLVHSAIQRARAMAPAHVPSSIYQTLVSHQDYCEPINVIGVVHEKDLTPDILQPLIDPPVPLGLAPGYSRHGLLIALAISNNANLLVIEFYSSRASDRRVSPPELVGRKMLQGLILCRPSSCLFAFDMAELCLALFEGSLNLHISEAVDIQSGFQKDNASRPSIFQSIVGAVGKANEKDLLHRPNLEDVFLTEIYDQEDKQRVVSLGQQAWIAQFVGTFENGSETFEKVPRIDTGNLPPSLFSTVVKLAGDQRRRKHMQPLTMNHQISLLSSSDNGKVDLRSDQFKNRVRGNENLRMVMTNSDGRQYVENATVGNRVKGQNAALYSSGALLDGKKMILATSTGRTAPTQAEAARSRLVLGILQNSQDDLLGNPWIRNIWFPAPDGSLIWPNDWNKETSLPPKPPNLNRSQLNAVATMLSSSNEDKLFMIHGPPGSGKTSVIANFVLSAVNIGRRGIWLVAQSNVAVKNIAEKLSSLNFIDFKLLVSDDFHRDWHEHLYQKFSVANIICSSDYKTVSRQSIQNIPVFLCTVSTLSNIYITKFTTCNPIRALIVDEASQIEIGDFLTVFTSFGDTLRKLCFIGDDKQLPPFGSEEIEDLKSVFEMDHIPSILLDTQYRMPPQVGDAISKLVYDNELKSNPKHPIKSPTPAVYFVDCPGPEKMVNTSYVNESEQKAVLVLAQYLQDQKKSYRIITPYDGQRNYIENRLKTSGVDWSDKCFNVDSFQGNEDDYMVVSVVRSHEPGFLTSLRRTNVMLTRFKKAMFIISSSRFLCERGAGSNSLVGHLLKELGDRVVKLEVANLVNFELV